MIHHLLPKEKNNQLILFFCRKNCNYSQQGIERMLSLGFELKVIYNQGKEDQLPSEAFAVACDYIICFRSWFILPQELLDLPKHYSINLHPGPPAYPGSGCVNFALYNEEDHFGVTTHLMNQKVDSGAIITYSTFPVAKHHRLEEVLTTTHQHLYDQLKELVEHLASIGAQYIADRLQKNKNIKWSETKRTLKELNAYREITPDITEEELSKRIRSFHHTDYPLYLTIRNKTFVLKQ